MIKRRRYPLGRAVRAAAIEADRDGCHEIGLRLDKLTFEEIPARGSYVYFFRHLRGLNDDWEYMVFELVDFAGFSSGHFIAYETDLLDAVGLQ